MMIILKPLSGFLSRVPAAHAWDALVCGRDSQRLRLRLRLSPRLHPTSQTLVMIILCHGRPHQQCHLRVTSPKSETMPCLLSDPDQDMMMHVELNAGSLSSLFPTRAQCHGCGLKKQT
eukprot:2273658-Rhodomonas_salina.5